MKNTNYGNFRSVERFEETIAREAEGYKVMAKFCCDYVASKLFLSHVKVYLFKIILL